MLQDLGSMYGQEIWVLGMAHDHESQNIRLYRGEHIELAVLF